MQGTVAELDSAIQKSLTAWRTWREVRERGEEMEVCVML